MRVLLDTHVVLWAATATEMLSPRAAEVLADEGTEAYISAASAWEIATKVRLGKLLGAEALERDFVGTTERAGYVLLPLMVETALRAGRLAGAHRDPWDRMIAAQALELDVPVISVDAKLDGFGVRRIW